MNTRRSVLLPVAVALSATSGCVPVADEAKHRAWFDNLSFAEHAVSESIRRTDSLFTARHLWIMAGTPDYILSADELQSYLVPDDEYQEWVLSELKYRFRKDIRSPSGDVMSDRSSPESPDATLEQCCLWLYDEAQHFARPIPGTEWAGFNCIFFYERNGMILDTTSLNYWRPMQLKQTCCDKEERLPKR